MNKTKDKWSEMKRSQDKKKKENEKLLTIFNDTYSIFFFLLSPRSN